MAGDAVLFNDMLGNTLAVNGKAVEMTSFGETADKNAFFTGKPMIDELGYSFLFRDYNPNQGKWTTTDPLGYPDGWNNLAYVNNEVVGFIDFLGCLKLRSRTIVWAGDSYTHTWISSDDGKTTLSGIPNNENYSGGSGSGSGSGEHAGGDNTKPATLIYKENYVKDLNAKNYSEIDIPLGNKSEKEILDEMKKKTRAYDETLPYDPLANGDAYNSNSLISRLLNAMGYDGGN
jgi:RHS repeat-associated protein